MKVDFEDHGIVSIVAVKGDFNTENIDSLKRGLVDRLDKGVRDFVIQLGEVDQIDSDGLELLLWLQDAAAEHLGQIRLVSITDTIKKILEITRLDNQFEQHDEITIAIRSLR